MQEVVEGSSDPVATLSQNGVFAPESSVIYLTPAQLELVQGDLTDMEDTMQFEITAWVVTDKLRRAKRANERTPARR